MSGHTTMRPWSASDAVVISARVDDARCFSTAASTASAYAAEKVTRQQLASGSCSAWAMRSMATSAGSAVSSATTQTSEGPAIISMPTSPETIFLAAATYALPGPVILHTGSMDSVP